MAELFESFIKKKKPRKKIMWRQHGWTIVMAIAMVLAISAVHILEATRYTKMETKLLHENTALKKENRKYKKANESLIKSNKKQKAENEKLNSSNKTLRVEKEKAESEAEYWEKEYKDMEKLALSHADKVKKQRIENDESRTAREKAMNKQLSRLDEKNKEEVAVKNGIIKKLRAEIARLLKILSEKYEKEK